MAERRPIVLDSGQFKELPIGDEIAGGRIGPPGFDGESPEPMMIPGPPGAAGPAGPAGGGSGSGSIGPPGMDGEDAGDWPIIPPAINIAAGLEVDAGVDGSKLITPASIAASKNVPHVAPGASGHILSSNGTDWVSSLPSTIAGIPSGIYAAPRTSNTEDDEFEGTSQDAKWTKTNSAALESFDDHIRSAAYYRFSTANTSDIILSQPYANAGDFSVTAAVSLHFNGNASNFAMQVTDNAATNIAEAQILTTGAGGPFVRNVKLVASVFSTPTTITLTSPITPIFLHIQRATNNWQVYYSLDGIGWTAIGTAMAITFTVAFLKLSFGNGGGAIKSHVAIHWFRRDWLTL